MSNFKLALAVAAAGVALLGASNTDAALIMTLQSGAASVTVNDGGAGDLDPAVGRITSIQSIDGFVTTISTGTSNSPGVSGLSQLQISSLDIRNSNAGTGTLTVTLGDTGFTSPTGPLLQLESGIGGTLSLPAAGDSVTFQSYANPSNTSLGTSGATFGPQSYVSLGGSPVDAFSRDNVVGFSAAAPYSLTNVTTVVLSPSSQVNFSGTTSVTALVPEPASIGLLGLGLTALGARRRRHS